MPTVFKYNYLMTATGVLEVDNMGQCAVKASNDFGEEYYLVMRTSLGKTYMFTYGPIVPDLDILPPHVSCAVDRFDYNEKKIKMLITRWLEDGKKNITKAEEVEDTEIFECCRDLIDYMKGYKIEED